MLTLRVEVPEGRDRTAIATLRDGLKTIATDHAVASASPAIAQQRGNPGCDPLRLWGHPPLGTYRMLPLELTQHDHPGEYGKHLLLFEPDSGMALEAESFGRLALLVYGGPAGRDQRMRRTQGGVRLSDTLLDTIVERLRSSGDLTPLQLEVVALRPPSWWQFWKKPAVTGRLSSETLEPLPPPLDEVSLLEKLYPGVARSRRRHMRDSRDDVRDTDSRDTSRSSSTGAEREVFSGKGGEFGGAGAGGRWDDAPGGARNVDQAGRIVAGAAAGVALGALASEALSAGAPQSTEGTSAGSDSAGSSSGTDTTAGTSY